MEGDGHTTPCQHSIDTRESLKEHIDRLNGSIEKVLLKLDRAPTWMTWALATMTGIACSAISLMLKKG